MATQQGEPVRSTATAPTTEMEAVLRASQPECVIALGLIIRGETAHGDLVADSVTQALQGIAVEHATPVVHEVILVDNEEQAKARCIESELNRGREAARAAVTNASTVAEVDAIVAGVRSTAETKLAEFMAVKP